MSTEINTTTPENLISSKMRAVVRTNSPLNDIVIDPDSTVSERVLLDTVAEKEVMDRVKVRYVRLKNKKQTECLLKVKLISTINNGMMINLVLPKLFYYKVLGYFQNINKLIIQG